MFSILAISALLAVASADTVGYHPAPAPQPYLAPQPYAFTYGVSDSYSGSEYAAQAADDGKVVTGSYSVRIASFQSRIISQHYNKTALIYPILILFIFLP